MPYRRDRCKRCLQPPPAGTIISARGLCHPCAVSATVQNSVDLRSKSGQYHRRWLAGLARFVQKQGAAEAAELGERASADTRA